MARVSRRNIAQANTLHNSASALQKISTALYARLSVEQNDNDTIETQIAFLKNYVSERNEFTVFNIYMDHGYTGTDFDRPGFTKMMSDVRAGHIQCIVIKDLSRFGRNMLETGYYIETLLPKLNVRLIAINDNYDSFNNDERNYLAVPITNMVNELYAKDISRKICENNKSRRKSGNYTIERSIYGFSVDKENNEFYVNPETAPVVQLAYRWYLDGVSGSEIAKRFNLLGIVTPGEYKYEKEFHKEKPGAHYWNSCMVLKMFINDAYAGDRCLGTRLHGLYKNQKGELKIPREQWTVYKNDHTPLVTREDFERAFSIHEANRLSRKEALINRRNQRGSSDELFSSLVICKKCGRVMHHEILKFPDGKLKPEGNSYVCKGHMGMEQIEGCGMRINDGYLQVLVTDQIRMLMKLIEEKNKLITTINKSHDKSPIYRIKSSINNLTFKESQISSKIVRLFEDYSDGLLDKEEYLALKTRYQNEREECKAKIVESSHELSQVEASFEKIKSIASQLDGCFDHIELTKEMVEMLIERIIVDQDHSIEIVFKCKDAIEDALMIAEEGDAI